MFRYALKQKALSSAIWGILDQYSRPGAFSTVRYHSSLSAALSRRRHVSCQLQAAIYGRRNLTSLSSHTDTIYALSSAHGRAGIAVIRISGPACGDVCLFLHLKNRTSLHLIGVQGAMSLEAVPQSQARGS